MLFFRSLNRVGKEYRYNSLSPESADQLPEAAVDQQQEEQPELHSIEVRPDDFFEKPVLRLRKICRLAPEMNETFGVTDAKRGGEINGGFPNHIVDERFFGETVYDREVIGDDNNFCHNHRQYGSAKEGVNADAILLEHQSLRERQQLECDEEEHHDRDQVPQFVL